MRGVVVLVTGSSGHLGEALMRRLAQEGHETRGLDVLAGAFTAVGGWVADAEVVRAAIEGVDVVLPAATLHKPHIATHTRQDFVRTNIAGTLTLLEAAVAAG